MITFNTQEEFLKEFPITDGIINCRNESFELKFDLNVEADICNARNINVWDIDAENTKGSRQNSKYFSLDGNITITCLRPENNEMQKVKEETQICESVIDGKKLAEQLKCISSYEWFIKDNDGSYTQDKFDLGIVLVNNLNCMSKEYDMLEYAEEMTQEKTDAVCKMLDTMFEFCKKRQIKYINLN